MAVKRYELSDGQTGEDFVAVARQGRRSGSERLGQPHIYQWLSLGVALGCALARSAGALWQMEDGA